VNIDPRTPAGQLFADRALAIEAIKSQVAYERVKAVSKQEHRPVPSRAVVAAVASGVAKASKSKTSAPVACYDSTGVLMGVVAPDALVDIPEGTISYDKNGKAVGFIGTDKKLTLFADGMPAVQKAITQATAVAKALAARRVAKGLSPTPTRRGKPVDAVEWLTSLGLRINAERVSKGMTPAMSDTRPIPPLVAAAIVYHHSTPAQKLAVRKVLARATPASRKAARIALLNAETAALGPRPTAPRR
jgi:hypothetical protein